MNSFKNLLAYLHIGKFCIQKAFRYAFYEFIPIHFTLSLLFPNRFPDNDRNKPCTFLIWFLGVYTAIYTLAYQTYESQKSALENRISFALTMTHQRSTFPELSRLQKSTIPLNPKYFDWKFSAIRSFVGEKEHYQKGVDDIKLVIQKLSDSLIGADLDSIDMSGIRFKNAKMQNDQLVGSNLSGISMWCSSFDNNVCWSSRMKYAWFAYCSIRNVNFINADLEQVNFGNCDLRFTDFRGANLRGAVFGNCLMDSTNFAFADLRGISKISSNMESALSFYMARMDDAMKNRIAQEWPEKLERKSKDPNFAPIPYEPCN